MFVVVTSEEFESTQNINPQQITHVTIISSSTVEFCTPSG